MALAGTPEPPTRALPSAWTSLDGGNVVQEAQEALEAYKKKDANKGASPGGLVCGRASCSLAALPFLPPSTVDLHCVLYDPIVPPAL